MTTSLTPEAKPSREQPADANNESSRRRVSVAEYSHYRQWGFLVVRGLVPAQDVAELRQHTEDLMQGRLPEQQEMQTFDPGTQPRGATNEFRREHGTVRHLVRPPDHLSPAEKAQHFLRIHMLHRQLALHERYMLHPRVLDVVEVLTGPDVLALQTMLFLKPPGKTGQGWHQDSYYIPTMPDTLIGAWIAIDDCDEKNGALWMAKGSSAEPVHPPCPDVGYGFGDRLLSDVKHIRNASDPNDETNWLAEVADKYDQVLVNCKAGDVVFFNGHVLHRSKDNWTTDRFRRAFVSHYCNARSFTQWNGEEGARDAFGNPAIDPVTRMTNGSHILARGDTHLPFALPRFGTPCAATRPAEERAAAAKEAARIIAQNNNGYMGCAIGVPEPEAH